jgi:hypothetical protein
MDGLVKIKQKIHAREIFVRPPIARKLQSFLLSENNQTTA